MASSSPVTSFDNVPPSTWCQDHDPLETNDLRGLAMQACSSLASTTYPPDLSPCSSSSSSSQVVHDNTPIECQSYSVPSENDDTSSACSSQLTARVPAGIPELAQQERGSVPIVNVQVVPSRTPPNSAEGGPQRVRKALAKAPHVRLREISGHGRVPQAAEQAQKMLETAPRSRTGHGRPPQGALRAEQAGKVFEAAAHSIPGQISEQTRSLANASQSLRNPASSARPELSPARSLAQAKPFAKAGQSLKSLDRPVNPYAAADWFSQAKPLPKAAQSLRNLDDSAKPELAPTGCLAQAKPLPKAGQSLRSLDNLVKPELVPAGSLAQAKPFAKAGPKDTSLVCLAQAKPFAEAELAPAGSLAQARPLPKAGQNLKSLATPTNSELSPPRVRSWIEKQDRAPLAGARSSVAAPTGTFARQDALRSLANSTNSTLVQPPPMRSWVEKSSDSKFEGARSQHAPPEAKKQLPGKVQKVGSASS